jgi:hypothetical protein
VSIGGNDAAGFTELGAFVFLVVVVFLLVAVFGTGFLLLIGIALHERGGRCSRCLG